MGTWGPHPFDSDGALEFSERFLARQSASEVRSLLQGYAVAGASGARRVHSFYDYDTRLSVMAACELVTATLASSSFYQSEGTTLFPRIAGKDVDAEPPFFPAPLATWAAQHPGAFGKDAADLADMALEALENDDEDLASWSDPDERLAAIREARARLNAAADAADATGDPS